MAGGDHIARGEFSGFALHFKARTGFRAAFDAGDLRIYRDLPAETFEPAGQRLRERTRTALRAPGPGLVNHRMPAHEVARTHLIGAGPRLGGQPRERGA